MDKIFKAISDPSRRALLDALLHRDGQTLSALEKHLDMTRFGVMKHIKVLTAAGLIQTQKKGRFKYHSLTPLALFDALDTWLDPMRIHSSVRDFMTLKPHLAEAALPDHTPDFEISYTLKSATKRVWQALTDPAEIPHYHFIAGQVLRQRTRLTHHASDGTTLLETIDQSVDPKRRLKQSFRPLWRGETSASLVVFTLEDTGGQTRLTIAHDKLNTSDTTMPAAWAQYVTNLDAFLTHGTSQFAT
jgi:DNA-binding transcriptional ArsR family regulator/uncharacterized protein YndB with AHSA1/START domain